MNIVTGQKGVRAPKNKVKVTVTTPGKPARSVIIDKYEATEIATWCHHGCGFASDLGDALFTDFQTKDFDINLAVAQTNLEPEVLEEIIRDAIKEADPGADVHMDFC